MLEENTRTPERPLDPTLASGRLTRLVTLSTVMVLGMVPEIASKTAEINGIIERNVLPEPWDWPDHVGNFNEAALYSAFAFSLISAIDSKRKVDTSKSLRRAAVGAFAVSAGIQIFGEKYGHLVGLPNHEDMIDSAYGIGFSAIAISGLYFGYKLANKKDEKVIESLEQEINAIQDEIDALEPKVNSINQGQKHTKTVSSSAKKSKRKQQKSSRKKNR